MVVIARRNSRGRYANFAYNRSSTSPSTKKRKPTYHVMISQAIVGKQCPRQGCSAFAISKFNIHNYYGGSNQIQKGFKTRLQHKLKQGVEEGWLIRKKRSFKLSPTEKRKASK